MLTDKAQFLFMPEFGAGIKNVVFHKWLVKEGGDVEEDQPLYEISTQKAIMEIESPINCKIVEFLCEPNDEVKSNTPIAKIIPYGKGEGKQGRAYKCENEISIIQEEPSNQVGVFNEKQQLFINHYRYSQAIPSSISFCVDDHLIENAKRQIIYDLSSQGEKELFITSFLIVVYAFLKACFGLSSFKKILVDNNKITVIERLSFGIAKADSEGNFDIITSLFDDSTSLGQFFSKVNNDLHQPMEQYKNNQVIPGLVFSYIGEIPYFGGTPILSSPSIATFFLGGKLSGNLSGVRVISITFDHRLLNGMHIVELIQAFNKHLVNFSLINSKQERESPVCFSDGFYTYDKMRSLILSYLNYSGTLEEDSVPLGLLGLNSLMATKLIAFLNQQFDLKLSVTVIWKYSTLENLIHYLLKRVHSL